MAVDTLVQSIYSIAHFPYVHFIKGFAINLHAAVYPVDFGEQFTFCAAGFNRCTKFGFAVMRQNHMLQQYALFFGNTEFYSNLRNLLCSHYKVAKKMSFGGIVRHKSKLGKSKFFFLSKVMESCTSKEQTAIHYVEI